MSNTINHHHSSPLLRAVAQLFLPFFTMARLREQEALEQKLEKKKRKKYQKTLASISAANVASEDPH